MNQSPMMIDAASVLDEADTIAVARGSKGSYIDIHRDAAHEASGDGSVTQTRPDENHHSTFGSSMSQDDSQYFDSPMEDEESVRHLGPLVVKIRELDQNYRRLDEFVQSGTDLPDVEAVESSDAVHLAGKANEYKTQLIRVDEVIQFMQERRQKVQGEWLKAQEQSFAASQRVRNVRAQHAKVSVATERLVSIEQQRQQLRNELRIE